MSTDQLRNSTYLHSSGAGNFRDQGNGAHAGTPSIGNTEKIRQSVSTLLGDNVALTHNKSIDLDRVYGSAAHSLGHQVAVSGRAEVVQSDVAAPWAVRSYQVSLKRGSRQCSTRYRPPSLPSVARLRLSGTRTRTHCGRTGRVGTTIIAKVAAFGAF